MLYEHVGDNRNNRLDIERFWEKVDTFSGPCWNWLGGRHDFGYGVFYVGGGRKAHRFNRASRFAWEDLVGPIPTEKLVLHSCDTPSCVNVKHLFLGTAKENTQDCISKGRFKRLEVLKAERHSEKKLSWIEVREIRKVYSPGRVPHNGRNPFSLRSLAERYRVSKKLILNVIHNRTWREEVV